jgi:hypothetical protein
MSSTQQRVFASATGLRANTNDNDYFDEPIGRTNNAKRNSFFPTFKTAGGKADAPASSIPEGAGVFGADASNSYRVVMLTIALAIVVVSSIYVGFLTHQRHEIEKQRSYASYGDLALRDPSTGLLCAQCDTSTGDIRIAAGTIFLGTGGVDLMPNTYTDSCMTCSSDVGSIYGLTAHNGIPLVQDDYVPLDTSGNTIYNYGHTMQAASGVAEDGGLPRLPHQIRTSQLNVRSGIVHFDRFAMGQECVGATCDTTYQVLTNAPTAGRTTGFPDLCSGTTSTIPDNSLYFVHRDIDAAAEFVGGATTLGDTTDGNALTFSHICTCITPPSASARVQFCSTPLIGAFGGDYGTPGSPVV